MHVACKEKLLRFLKDPCRVRMGRTAERDLSITPVRKLGLLQSMCDFIDSGKTLRADYMEHTGDEAFIFEYCRIEEVELYVKACFQGAGRSETLFIFSAHPSRRW